MFGRHEPTVAAAYRRFFVDLDSFAATLHMYVPMARRILEIGCGEGQMTERLVRTYPNAEIHGIDLIPLPGRLFRGDRTRVRFSSISLERLLESEKASFDLVMLVDVLHHIPVAERQAFLSSAATSVAPGGIFAFKEWVRYRTVGYYLGYAADRFITGDDVLYQTKPELKVLAQKAFNVRVHAEWHIPPWKSNVCLLLRRPG
jgi:2-polyprenyl-6-hydroxyphenyl methylase/3-demethylubiquinone-9 3-methyltransferase